MNEDLPRVIDARHAGGYRVWLRFANDVTGEIDLSDVLWGPVFEPLKDVREFAKLRADPELETVVWENGADLAPESLYGRVKASKRVAAE
jgi:hypothetical protein